MSITCIWKFAIIFQQFKKKTTWRGEHAEILTLRSELRYLEKISLLWFACIRTFACNSQGVTADTKIEPRQLCSIFFFSLIDSCKKIFLSSCCLKCCSLFVRSFSLIFSICLFSFPPNFTFAWRLQNVVNLHYTRDTLMVHVHSFYTFIVFLSLLL